MACLDHICNECEYGWMDNDRNSECPRCGSHSHSTHFDEEPTGRVDEEEEDNGEP